MDITNEQISRSRGVTAFGFDGYQQIYSQYNSSFTFASSLIPYEEPINFPIQQAVDSCWTTGNIYRLDVDSGRVVKATFQNEILSSLNLSSPKSLSVVQFVVPMELDNPTDTECLGCWIVDGTSVLRTDSDLNIEIEIESLVSPSLICTNHLNGGCFVVDEGVGIYEFDGNGDLVGVGTFTDDHILGMLSNSNGAVLVLTEEELYKFVNNSGNLNVSNVFNLSSYFTGSLAIGCFDIDTVTNYVYVAGGDNTTLKVSKFNESAGYLGAVSSSNSFPYIIKVSQHPSSDTFYVLTDSEKIDFVESSSSESSEGYSSSSESSSSSSIDSSSSSSDAFDPFTFGSFRSYYTMDEVSGNRFDSRGVNDLTEVGSVGSTSVGAANNNIANGFNLSNYLKNTNTVGLKPTNNYIISIWVDFSSGGSIIRVKNPDNYWLRIYPLNPGSEFSFTEFMDVVGGGTQQGSTNHPYTPGLHHIIIMSAILDTNLKTKHIYYDGVEILSTQNFNELAYPVGDYDFFIGSDGNQTAFNGGVDELGIWIDEDTENLASQEWRDEFVNFIWNGGIGRFPFDGSSSSSS